MNKPFEASVSNADPGDHGIEVIGKIGSNVVVEKVKSTPANRWSEKNETDPFADYINMNRADLCLGKLSDDELANGVFLFGNAPFDLQRILDGGYSSIAYLTAAKEHIRWLSRQLTKALEELNARQS